jgi:uncharacterized membrane protein
MESEQHAQAAMASPMAALKTIPNDAPMRWLAMACNDFRSHPGASLFYGACYAVCGWVLAFAFNHAYALFAALSTGFMLLGPVLAIGLYDLSRRAEAGEPVALRPTLTAWRRNLSNLSLFSAVIIVVLLIWARASVVIFALFFEGGLPTFGEVVRQALTLAQPEFTLIYFGVGAIFATFIYTIAVIGVPLMLDRQTDAITAGLTSILAVGRNPVPFALWALIIAFFGMLGMATLFFGLAIFIPLLGHATWHAYREVMDRPAD